MIKGQHPVVQALLGTLLTWGFTALGSAMVFVLDVEDQVTSQKLLDGMLGFAGGVMLAASYWSLLAPSIEIAAESDLYGPNGRWSFVPAAVGFILGALTLFGTERVLPFFEKYLGLSPLSMSGNDSELKKKKKDDDYNDKKEVKSFEKPLLQHLSSFRRVLLLVIAITLHNLPEGMAVGVGFGSIGHSTSATYVNAVNLAIGIGLQNFPEGLAVSMPLKREGMTAFKAFMWGQASGLVEPIGGLIGAGAVLYVQPILPYALSFAAGAMIFVVVDDLIPETTQSGNQKLATFGTILGFVVMMVMDVALG
ncbi:zinc (zn2)-iron (fe2) permease family [Plasmopara halstedii]|uniref:Zinc transporter ZIP11 n=1 Tax=Plasmopara halstedii TaxID=4781 RepID=A0A0P1ADS9_PLAHL|nr:zinc (zn2)-iron (fe2) permease family [Plasmopara halstedii]CEG38655.1 zinc (zn2)-iron (fe2) permease family [Plasmopara halstedii]|eukprot:XP_024575024.1 zinc (zn2)-iron (fe2) permease family [Plasmopara halstedii]